MTPPSEPQCLRLVRTEEGKRLRWDYEAHRIHHGFNEHRVYDCKSNGLCATISTVLKDYMVIIPIERDEI